jgi:hypothetical protein
MAPHGVVESEVGRQEFSLRGSVVIDSLEAFEAEAKKPKSPFKGLNAHATIMVANEQAEAELKRAISLATQGDDRKPFTVTVEPDGLGATFVDGVRDDVYKEKMPSEGKLLILGDQG